MILWSKTYFFWFPYLLYYWLLAKWSLRSSAYCNRRKLNINNRLFPSRLLFVNKGYKWNKAGKTISTTCSWFSGTWSTCSFPQPSLELQMPSALHTCLQGHSIQSAEHGDVWKSLFYQGAPHGSLTLPEDHFGLYPKHHLSHWRSDCKKCRAKDLLKHSICLHLGSEVFLQCKPYSGLTRFLDWLCKFSRNTE